ncbi:MAG: hypothetical protein LC798_12885 [Chloroflexi bacterium]|nr:hypothetical protein [Chloroflexota bacterium]
MAENGGAMRELRLLRDYGGNGNPVIAEEFRGGRGWVRQSWRKRASSSWLNKLRAEGVTHVAVEFEQGRVVDFTVNEILEGGTVR